MRGKITRRNVASLRARAIKNGKDEFLWDTEMSGFGAKAGKSAGLISFVVQYRAGHSRKAPSRRLVIGTERDVDAQGRPWSPETARAEAKRLLGLVAAGKDPAADRAADRAADTLGAFADRYLAEYAATKKRASSVRMDRVNLNAHILPVLGARKISEIGRADVARLHHAMRATPGAANRVLALLSKMFALAEKWGLRPDGSNPCRHVEKYPERKRERFLSSVELARLGDALTKAEGAGDVSPHFAALVRLLLLTGARLSEIMTAKWDWLDFERGVLRLPDSKTGQKEIALPAPALALLKGLPRIEGNPHIIPGHKSGDHLRNPWKPWDAIRERAKLGDVRIHDLRHSFASVGASAGLSLRMIGDLLGHTQAQTTQRYAHLAANPRREAADRIAGTIAAAMQGKAGTVVPMKRSGRKPRR